MYYDGLACREAVVIREAIYVRSNIQAVVARRGRGGSSTVGKADSVA